MTFREQLAHEQATDLPPNLRAAFDLKVADGVKAPLALMLVLQSPPGGKGNVTPKFHTVGGRTNDQAFLRSARKRMNEMSQSERDKITGIARKAGISTEGKFYCGRLGKYDNPLAWCSTAQDVLDSCKRQNLTASGAVDYKAPVPAQPVQGPALAPDILARECNKLMGKDPKLAEQVRKGKVKKQEVRERVIAKHGKKRLVYGG